ncbi:hypothetical protein [Actinomadura sp. HBU206391]|uniref:hypothetical protein n=1 Tax=Actinomadura sp. HBU206391 TaxID=2731692 RepID=UPI00164F5DBD|nr:hypothetical protein [Actinomadura sp. HBU206391]MBC6457633.1 hypothetical protein [Actinomadura sp. HBU206391]
MTQGPPQRPGNEPVGEPGGTPAGRPSGPDEVLRFGPGVQPTDQLTETWRSGRAQPPRRRRRLVRNLVSWLITAALLVGVLLWLLLRGQASDVEITAIKVQTPKQVQDCNATVDVTGVLTTNGEAGQITYRWVRSDGHDSGLLHETVEAGKRDVTVHLSWAIKGPGERRFTATLELVEPKSTADKASSAFRYSC